MERPLEVAVQAAHVTLSPPTRMVRVDLSLNDPDVYRIFADLQAEARDDFALRALKVGVLALRDAHTVAKTDYVDKEFARVRADFDERIEVLRAEMHKVFGDDGAVEQRMQAFFGPKGRFPAIVDDFIGPQGKLATSLDDRLGEDGDFPRKMDEFLDTLRQEMEREFGEDGGRLYRALDPDNATTPLGRFMRTLEERFDPACEGSALWTLKRDMAAQIDQRFQELRLGLGLKQAVEEERAKGTRKGLDFQEDVLGFLEAIVAPYGDRVEDTSKLNGPLGDVGDAVCTLNPDTTGGLERRIVVEAKKKKGLSFKGKDSIHKELDEALRNRDAHVAIAAVHAPFAEKFAPLRYVAPNHILVAVDEQDDDPLALKVAYQLARALVTARDGQREATLDVGSVLAGLGRINSQLENVQAMRTNLSGAADNIENARKMLGAMQKSIKETVDGLVETVQAGDGAAAKA